MYSSLYHYPWVTLINDQEMAQWMWIQFHYRKPLAHIKHFCRWVPWANLNNTLRLKTAHHWVKCNSITIAKENVIEVISKIVRFIICKWYFSIESNELFRYSKLIYFVQINTRKFFNSTVKNSCWIGPYFSNVRYGWVKVPWWWKF